MVKLIKDPTPEQHKTNCMEFGLLALKTLQQMTQQQIADDMSLIEKAFSCEYNIDVNPSEFGINMMETYLDFKNNKVKVH